MNAAYIMCIPIVLRRKNTYMLFYEQAVCERSTKKGKKLTWWIK